MSEHERLHSSDVCVQFVSHDQLVIGKDRSFRFDEVFPPDTSQVNVFLKLKVTKKNLHIAYCMQDILLYCNTGVVVIKPAAGRASICSANLKATSCLRFSDRKRSLSAFTFP